MKQKSCLLQVQKRGEFWQRVLRLRDWQIFWEVQRYHEMSNASADATISIRTRHKVARIVVKHPDDYPPDAWRPYDLDRMMVHELLHLGLNFVPDALEDEEEQFVEVMSTQIVAIWRGKFGNGTDI